MIKMTNTTAARPALLTRTGGLLTALAAATLLSACAAPLLMGGAMVGGSLMVTDRRTSGTQIEDQAIELKANGRATELLGDRARVGATSYNRQVLLTGEVASEADKAALAQTVSRIENVRSIFNEVAVAGSPSLTARANDALVSTRVKATLVDAKDLSANAFKVVTERGTVYLMGVVTEREATRASDLTRTVGGVQKVVRLFEIVTEEQLADKRPR
jgi:osmotically-inducible protein OsmY